MTGLSDKCEPVSARTVALPLCRAELAPLGESSGTIEFEVFVGIEVAFQVEMIVN